jgi:hypothetical protein
MRQTVHDLQALRTLHDALLADRLAHVAFVVMIGFVLWFYA